MKQYFNAWNQILHRGNRTSTLKFAWARALLDEFKAARSHNEPVRISTTEMADRLLLYYWNQICRYRLRQSPALIQAPLVERLIHNLDQQGTAPRRFTDLDDATQTALRQQLATQGFREVRPRFHNLHRRKTRVAFYRVVSGALMIEPPVATFFTDYHPILLDQVLFQWAKTLGQWNRFTPCIVEKLATDPDAERKSLAPHRAWLKRFKTQCFYCGTNATKYEVDHFIPWSYMLEDERWNLVLACRTCNGSQGKWNKLPTLEFLEKLVDRNEVVVQKAASEDAAAMRASLDRLRAQTRCLSDRDALEGVYNAAVRDGFLADWAPESISTLQ